MSGDGSRQFRALSSLRCREVYNFQSDYEQTSGRVPDLAHNNDPSEAHNSFSRAHMRKDWKGGFVYKEDIWPIHFSAEQKKLAEIEMLMDRDTFISPEDAVKLGLVDKVVN